MYTYFLASRSVALQNIRTIGDLLTYIMRDKVQVGGFYSRERIDYLTNVFLRVHRPSFPTEYGLSDRSVFYQVDPELTACVASRGHDELLDASLIWDQGAWQGMEINPFDLAGFLIEFAELCKIAVSDQKEVYFITTAK